MSTLRTPIPARPHDPELCGIYFESDCPACQKTLWPELIAEPTPDLLTQLVAAYPLLRQAIPWQHRTADRVDGASLQLSPLELVRLAATFADPIYGDILMAALAPRVSQLVGKFMQRGAR